MVLNGLWPNGLFGQTQNIHLFVDFPQGHCPTDFDLEILTWTLGFVLWQRRNNPIWISEVKCVLGNKETWKPSQSPTKGRVHSISWVWDYMALVFLEATMPRIKRALFWEGKRFVDCEKMPIEVHTEIFLLWIVRTSEWEIHMEVGLWDLYETSFPLNLIFGVFYLFDFWSILGIHPGFTFSNPSWWCLGNHKGIGNQM